MSKKVNYKKAIAYSLIALFTYFGAGYLFLVASDTFGQSDYLQLKQLDSAMQIVANYKCQEQQYETEINIPIKVTYNESIYSNVTIIAKQTRNFTTGIFRDGKIVCLGIDLNSLDCGSKEFGEWYVPMCEKLKNSTLTQEQIKKLVNTIDECNNKYKFSDCSKYFKSQNFTLEEMGIE